MRFFFKAKDGGPESRVWGYWLCEGKSSFSIALLRFEDGSREAFHSHAFNSISLVLRGALFETLRGGTGIAYWTGAIIRTYRETFHRVESYGRTWVLTFRGPWSKTWKESTPEAGVYELSSGRKRVS